MDGGGGGGAAPTGCYKCGRPGHWSRDCPSNPNQNPNPSSSNFPKTKTSNFKSTGGGIDVGDGSIPSQKLAEKPKKVPRSRPKLTPDLLLSNDGIGYVLRHFPRAFKYHGRGHEVSDLGNLIGLYAEWHSHLLSYYSFDQFINKVEQVGATRHVKICLGGLRDRVANGGDPTKLHEPPAEQNISNADEEDMNIEEPSLVQQDTSLKNSGTDDFQEDMLQEVFAQTSDELSPAICSDAVATDHLSSRSSSMNLSIQVNASCDSNTREMQVSEEQKARMEASRLKALEKAAARARSSQTA